MIRRIRLALVVFVAVVLQTTLMTHLRIDGVAADLAVVCVLAVACENGPDNGAVFGFVMGLAVDMFLTTPLGLSALSYAVTGYAAGAFHAGLVRSLPWEAPMFGGVGGFFGGLVFVTVGALTGQPGFLSFESVKVVVIGALLDAVIALLVFPIAKRAARRGDHMTWSVRP